MATGPAFQKGGKSVPFIKNVDLYSLFSHIYGIKDAPSTNGTLGNLNTLLATEPQPAPAT